MTGVIRSRPVSLVASVAGCRQRGVVVVGMAGSALQSRVCSGKRKRSVVVVERGRTPCTRCVANGAVGREAGGHVIRIRRSCEVSLVA